MRIASLLPSATEIVCALEAQAELVGVSHECDFPAGVEELPALTRARLSPVRSSRDIDREVRAVLQDALAVYEIELERLERAAPDLIVTQDLCDVCAVSFDDVCAAVSKLAKKDVPIVNLHPTRLADIWSDIERVGRALGRAELAERVVADLQARVAAISKRAQRASSKPTILSIEWIAPVMSVGWMRADQRAGGKGASRSRVSSDDAFVRAIVHWIRMWCVKPLRFPLPRTLEELPVLREALPWSQWRAVRERRVYVADGNAYFNRPGPRIVESLEILAACAHPELFEEFAQAHAAWVVRL